MSENRTHTDPNPLLAMVEAVALEAVISSIDESMEQHRGDGGKVFNEEGVRSPYAVLRVIRKRVQDNVRHLDKSDEIQQIITERNFTPENVRLAENVTQWTEGFLAGLRWMRNDRDAKVMVEQEIKDAMRGEGSNAANGA